jgi:hypothetical protein
MTIQQLIEKIKRDNQKLKQKINNSYHSWKNNSTDYDSLTAEEQLTLEDLNQQNR